MRPNKKSRQVRRKQGNKAETRKSVHINQGSKLLWNKMCQQQLNVFIGRTGSLIKQNIKQVGLNVWIVMFSHRLPALRVGVAESFVPLCSASPTSGLWLTGVSIVCDWPLRLTHFTLVSILASYFMYKCSTACISVICSCRFSCTFLAFSCCTYSTTPAPLTCHVLFRYHVRKDWTEP